jgi:hypothetical protein
MDVVKEESWDNMRGAVHHWDINRVLQDSGSADVGIPKVPRVVEETQKEIVRFVGVWIEQFWEEQEQKRRRYTEESVKGNCKESTMFDLGGKTQ